MNREERINDKEEVYRLLLDSFSAGLFVATPAIIEHFDEAKMTVSAQPSIKGRVRLQTGEYEEQTLPLLVDCPVVFPQGGGFNLTFPIKVGDECLIVFADRCIDAWWQSGGVQSPIERRFHSIADGFAIVGARSLARALSGVSTTAAQLRSDDGSVFVEVSGTQAKVSAPYVKVHAGTSYEWDVHGYGQRITWTGGTNWTVDNYTTGATVTTNNHSIAPPEAP